MNPKPFFKSRTALFNLLCLLALLIPGASEWLRDHAESVLAIISLTNVVLRCITKRAVVLIPDPEADFFDDDNNMSCGGGYARP